MGVSKESSLPATTASSPAVTGKSGEMKPESAVPTYYPQADFFDQAYSKSGPQPKQPTVSDRGERRKPVSKVAHKKGAAKSRGKTKSMPERVPLSGIELKAKLILEKQRG